MWCVSVMCTQTILIRLCNENKTYNLLFCALNDTITCKLWWIVPGWAATSLAFWFFIVKCTTVNCCWHQTTRSATTNVLLVHSSYLWLILLQTVRCRATAGGSWTTRGKTKPLKYVKKKKIAENLLKPIIAAAKLPKWVMPEKAWKPTTYLISTEIPIFDLMVLKRIPQRRRHTEFLRSRYI